MLLASRPARPVADHVKARAAEYGVTVSDYIAAVLARDAGREDLAHLPARHPQQDQELPLTG